MDMKYDLVKWRLSLLLLPLAWQAGCVAPRTPETPLADTVLSHRQADAVPAAGGFEPRVVPFDPSIARPAETAYAPPVVEPRASLAPDTPPNPQHPEPIPRGEVPDLDFETVLAAQSALDGLNFSPGCLDGRLGGKTRQALRAWRESVGRTWDGTSEEALMQELAGRRDAVETITLSARDVAGLTAVPASWPERAKLASLDHETVLERIAERYHATEGLIRELNPGVGWPDPAAGTTLRVPNVSRGRSLRAARLEVYQDRRVVKAYDAAGTLVAYFPCSIAASVANRPSGDTTVKNQAADPTYTFDPKTFPEVSQALKGTQRLIIPAGPNNPVGTAWVGLNLPGYGIHGTPKPERIGNAESHGCIRLANWNALKLAHMVRAGTPVKFVDGQ